MTRITALCLALLTISTGACGGGAAAGAADEEEAASEESSGAEQPVGAEEEAVASEDTAAADEEAMTKVTQLSMQLGSYRAAFEKNMEKRRPDCAKADSQRDRICETTAEMCEIAEKHSDAQPHCERASGKCEKAKADVKELRCH